MTIRALANGGTTIEDLRRAVLTADTHPKLVKIRLADQPLKFPSACPNCGQPANSNLLIERSFLIQVYSGGDTPNHTEACIDAIGFPFCKTCAMRQQMEQVAPGPWTPVKRLFSHAEGFAGLVVIGISGLFFSDALRHLRLFPLMLGCLPLLVGISLIRPVWRKSRYMSLPLPTPVDMAVDFTPNLALEYESAWRTFEFRSPSYADLFRKANESLAWDARSTEAKAARDLRKKDSTKSNWIFGAIMAIALIWILWDKVLSAYVMPMLHSR